jgi:YgiT-type zinc finger domain-containing protein
MSDQKKPEICNFCGGDQFVTRRLDYLYSYQGEYLIVPNTPVQMCLQCGMVYYEAAVLKEIERRFFAIHQHTEQPDRYLQVPSVTFA